MKNVCDIKIEKNMNYILPTNYSKKENIYLIQQKKILIIIHLHYLDTVSYYLSFVKFIPDNIDIIFTISDETVKDVLQEADILRSRRNCRIVEKRNRGRDISAILVACRTEILKYDYICFLHDKKEKSIEYKDDIKQWIHCLWENMIGSKAYIENVLDLFLNNPDLGLLVPPFPISRHLPMLYTDVWGRNYSITKDLIDRMGLKCDLSMDKQPITLGTVFWAKVAALRKLFEIEWKYEDFDDEPLKIDGTISHSIERVLAYVAQDAGFDTGWVMTDRYAGEFLEYTRDTLKKIFYRLDSSLGILKISELESYDRRATELMEFIDHYEKFYIFGAGEWGNHCFLMLNDQIKTPSAFLVSDTSHNCKSMYGIPVCALSEVKIDEKIAIIIAVGEKYRAEVLDLFRESYPDFCNIYLYKKE